jgi:hypothetical protein
LTAFDRRLVSALGGQVREELVDEAWCPQEHQGPTFIYAPCGQVRIST